jgi:hypothetical protein
VGIAVYPTSVPSQTLFPDAVITTFTGRRGLVVKPIRLELAGLPVAHVELDNKVQETVSPFRGTKLNIEFVAPETTVPPAFHW